MADNNIIKLRVDSNEYESKIKRASQGITDLANSLRDSKKSFAEVDKEQLQYIQALGKMDTVSKDARGSVKELTGAYIQLSAEYNKLSQAEKDAASGQALAKSLEELKQRVQDGKKELEDINRELNATSNEGQETGGVMKQLTDRFTINIDAMKLFEVGLSAINGALSVAKDAFFASESNVDEWGRTVEAAKSVYSGFLTAINTGDISGFLTRIDEIVAAAKTAYNELDRLGTMKTIQAPQMSAQQTEIERIRAMLRTGRGIESVSGAGRLMDRMLGIKNGEQLSESATRILKEKLQLGIDSIIDLTKNEVQQSDRAINAVYNQLAKDLGFSLAEFRKGTSSMEELDRRIEGARKYNEWQYDNSFIDQASGRIVAPRTGNPYAQYRGWDVFKDDGEKYQNLVQLILQRNQQISSVYSMQSQAYRSMNTAENRITPHGGGGGGGRTTLKPEEVREATGLIEIQQQKIKELQQQINQAPTESIITYLRGELQVAQEELDRLNGKTKELGETVTEEANAPLVQMTNILKQLNEQLMLAETPEAYQEILADIKAINQEMDTFKGTTTNEINKDAKQTENSWKAAAQAVQSVGSALQQIEDPGAKIVGIIGQAIAQIALGFAQATTAAATGGPFAWIAAIAGGIGTMTSAIAAIHSATGYAEGGIVKGNTFSGDQIPADTFVNAGELILNRSQQNMIASQLQEASRGGGGNGLARVSGEQIYIAMNAYLRRSGKGELVTWK